MPRRGALGLGIICGCSLIGLFILVGCVSGTPTPTGIPTRHTLSSDTPTVKATYGATETASVTATPAPTYTAGPELTPTDTFIPLTPMPTLSSSPTPTSTPHPMVTAFETTMVIPTYPYQKHLVWEVAPAFGIRFLRLDWGAYEAAGPQPTAQTYRAIVLENDYLKLTLLPDLGGRVYQCIFKPTGRGVLYNNPVIKPTRWGPKEQGWWLAVGGIEYGLPVEEHGYETAIPWAFEIRQSPAEISVRMTDSTEGGRLRATVEIVLPAGEARFFLRPRLENGTAHELSLKYWTNAMIALGGANRVSDGVQFIIPGNQVTVHSSGDETLPQPGQAMSWPVWNGRDMSRPANWRNWLGFFERPQASHSFAGIYDHRTDEGIVRVFPPEITKGVKGFGFGRGPAALSPSLWTDDDSSYVELHGGLAPTFDDVYTLPAGGVVEWEEIWFPAAGLGGMMLAGPSGAANLQWEPGRQGLMLILAFNRRWEGEAAILLAGDKAAVFPVRAEPGRWLQLPLPPAREPAAGAPIEIQLSTAGGQVETWAGPYRPPKNK